MGNIAVKMQHLCEKFKVKTLKKYQPLNFYKCQESRNPLEILYINYGNNSRLNVKKLESFSVEQVKMILFVC